MPLPCFANECDNGIELRLKVVPGASRSRIVGLLGDRLKIQVAAPPEGSKANKAVLVCLAKWLGIAKSNIQLISGHSQALKTVRIPRQTAMPSVADT